MWKRDKLFCKYSSSKDKIQKMVTHNKFEKLRINVTYLIPKSKNECFKIYFKK